MHNRRLTIAGFLKVPYAERECVREMLIGSRSVLLPPTCVGQFLPNFSRSLAWF